MIPNKKRRSSDCDSDGIEMHSVEDGVFGSPFCTPHGISVVSSTLYSEYVPGDRSSSRRMRPLVHCKSRDWWVERQQAENLGISHAWIYTDAPCRRIDISEMCPVSNPAILPFLHRRGLIRDMRTLRFVFSTKNFGDVATFVLSVLHEVERLFNFRLSDLWPRVAGLSGFLVPPLGRASNFVMCHTKAQGRCYGCDRNYVIVSEFCKEKMCNKCSKRVHALTSLVSRVAFVDSDTRFSDASFSSLVDCCMTIEESFQSESPRVLDYSKQQ